MLSANWRDPMGDSSPASQCGHLEDKTSRPRLSALLIRLNTSIRRVRSQSIQRTTWASLASPATLTQRSLLLTQTQTLQIDSIPEGSIVFVSSPPITSNAVYGGLMSTRARAAGAVGTVVDGRFRDVQEQRDLNYPVSTALLKLDFLPSQPQSN